MLLIQLWQAELYICALVFMLLIQWWQQNCFIWTGSYAVYTAITRKMQMTNYSGCRRRKKETVSVQIEAAKAKRWEHGVIERPVIYVGHAMWRPLGAESRVPKAGESRRRWRRVAWRMRRVFLAQCTRGSGKCRKRSAEGADNTQIFLTNGPWEWPGNQRRLGAESRAPKAGESRRLRAVG